MAEFEQDGGVCDLVDAILDVLLAPLRFFFAILSFMIGG